LYHFLCRRFGGDVLVVNQGQPFRSRSPADPNSRIASGGGGEEYRVCCPLCHETRHRLYVNHAFGRRIRGKLCFAVHCFNQRHDGLGRWLFALLRDAGVPDSGPDLAAEDHDGSTEAAERHERIPAERFSLLGELPGDHPAVRYVESRGFDPAELTHWYRAGYSGGEGRRVWERRLVAPVYCQDEEVGWSARAIPGHTRLTAERPERNWPWREGKYVNARGFPKSLFVYNLDVAGRLPDTVVAVAEGVTDVWRIGPWAVALFGKTLSDAQCRLICEAAAAKRAWIALLGDAPSDRDDSVMAWERNYSMLRRMYRYPGQVVLHLFDRGDPGDHDRQEIFRIVKDMTVRQQRPARTRNESRD
jgi:hypothetical protein